MHLFVVFAEISEMQSKIKSKLPAPHFLYYIQYQAHTPPHSAMTFDLENTHTQENAEALSENQSCRHTSRSVIAEI